MKKLLTLIALFCCIISLHAQEITIWDRANLMLTKPADIDTTRLYQPKPAFSLGLFTTGQKAGFHTDVNFDIDWGELGSLYGLSTYSLDERMCKKIGLEVAYGNVNFGYGVEVGHRSAWKKSAFALNILGKSWGVHFNYFKITNPFVSGLTLWDENNNVVKQDEITTEEVATQRNFTIDGYYVFNNRRFAYPAAYKISLVQRHTAGSWMLAARYMQGELYNSPEAAWDSYNLIDCFSTIQASIGGGYSVNFVLWHNDPIGPRDEKLRNFTINLTAMPVLTVFNRLRTTSYEYDEEGNYSGEQVSKIYCFPLPNFIGSAAACLTLKRFYFSTQFTYNRFYFRSRDAYDSSKLEIPDYIDNLSYRGTFHDWTLKILLAYRF